MAEEKNLGNILAEIHIALAKKAPIDLLEAVENLRPHLEKNNEEHISLLLGVLKKLEAMGLKRAAFKTAIEYAGIYGDALSKRMEQQALDYMERYEKDPTLLWSDVDPLSFLKKHAYAGGDKKRATTQYFHLVGKKVLCDLDVFGEDGLLPLFLYAKKNGFLTSPEARETVQKYIEEKFKQNPEKTLAALGHYYETSKDDALKESITACGKAYIEAHEDKAEALTRIHRLVMAQMDNKNFSNLLTALFLDNLEASKEPHPVASHGLFFIIKENGLDKLDRAANKFMADVTKRSKEQPDLSYKDYPNELYFADFCLWAEKGNIREETRKKAARFLVHYYSSLHQEGNVTESELFIRMCSLASLLPTKTKEHQTALNLIEETATAYLKSHSCMPSHKLIETRLKETLQHLGKAITRSKDLDILFDLDVMEDPRFKENPTDYLEDLLKIAAKKLTKPQGKKIEKLFREAAIFALEREPIKAGYKISTLSRKKLVPKTLREIMKDLRANPPAPTQPAPPSLSVAVFLALYPA